MTDLPVDVEERLTPLAATVTEDATTDYDRALALQNWFRTEFDYSLETVEGNSATALESFLRGPQRLLRAVRRDDGADGAHPRHPVAGAGGLHSR